MSGRRVGRPRLVGIVPTCLVVDLKPEALVIAAAVVRALVVSGRDRPEVVPAISREIDESFATRWRSRERVAWIGFQASGNSTDDVHRMVSHVVESGHTSVAWIGKRATKGAREMVGRLLAAEAVVLEREHDWHRDEVFTYGVDVRAHFSALVDPVLRRLLVPVPRECWMDPAQAVTALAEAAIAIADGEPLALRIEPGVHAIERLAEGDLDDERLRVWAEDMREEFELRATQERVLAQAVDIGDGIMRLPTLGIWDGRDLALTLELRRIVPGSRGFAPIVVYDDETDLPHGATHLVGFFCWSFHGDFDALVRALEQTGVTVWRDPQISVDEDQRVFLVPPEEEGAARAFLRRSMRSEGWRV